MLMGCASAQLINPDEAKNRKKNFHGIIADYVSSDVICAMGNLWSVTDRDSDLITLDILEKWDGIEENTSLETLNMIAKRARKLANQELQTPKAQRLVACLLQSLQSLKV